MKDKTVDEINQILMCFEKHIYSELGNIYPVTNQRRLNRPQAKLSLLQAIKGVSPKKAAEVLNETSENGDVWAKGYNQALADYKANLERLFK